MPTVPVAAPGEADIGRLIQRLTLSYALFAGAWIVLSDELLTLVVNSALVGRLGTAKGLAFVGLTSLLLYLALGAVARRSASAAREEALVPPRIAPLSSAAAFAFATLATAAAFAIRATIDIEVVERPMMIVFMLPITLAALFGGLGPGLLATALTVLGLCAVAFGVDPVDDHGVREIFRFQLLVLCGNGVAVSLAANALHRAHRDTRQALQRERASRDEYRVLSDQLPDPVWRKDRDGRYLDCNERFAAVVGAPRTSIIGRTDADFFAPEVAANFAALDRAVLESRESTDQEEWWTAPGNLGWVQVQRAPVLDADGECSGTLGIARDINRRHVAERALREREALFRTLFDIGEDAVLIVPLSAAGARGQVTHCNAAAEHVFGQPRASLLELAPSALLEEADVTRFDDAFAAAVSAGRAHLTATGLHRNGRRIPLELTLIRFELGDFSHQAVLIALRDVSARLDAAAEQARLNQQVMQMQKLEAIGQLTGGIAHDFNNILATILGFTELAMRSLDTSSGDRVQGHLAQVGAAAQRGRDLVSKMLAFSRSRGTPLAPSAVAPYPAVREAVALLRSTIPATIDIVCELAPTAGVVGCEAVELEQLVMNLAINARDAIAGAGRISIALHPARVPPTVCAACLADFAGDFVEIAVSDTGNGIPAAELSRIFQPFFTTKEVGKGTGLGLSVVHGIVHRAGGHMQVESAPGRGTTFRVWLPAVAPHDATVAAAPAPRDTTQGGGGRHVLVIDDEAPLGRYWREVLQGAGYRVSVFEDSRAALASFRAAPRAVDAVLCDLNMPRLPGDVLAGELLAQRPDLPLFLMSGNADPTATEALLKRGVRACYGKPVDSATVLEALQRALA